MTNNNTRRGFTQNVVICPPCGESVAVATKEGHNKEKAVWPLLPRLTAVLPPQGREINPGFTLIELLVVVLIIGILAAIALPQYQKAVQKTRFSEALANIHTLQQVVDSYRLEKGYPDEAFDTNIIDELEVSVTSPNFAYTVFWDGLCGQAEEPRGYIIMAQQADNYRLVSTFCNLAWEATNCEVVGESKEGTVICSLFEQMYP